MKLKTIIGTVTALLFLMTGMAHAAWTEGSVIGVHIDQPRDTLVWAAVGVDGDTSSLQWPTDHWNRVDISGLVPPDTKAVAISTILIITHGSAPGLCSLSMWFKAPTFTGFVRLNAESVSVEGGERGSDMHWVPVVNGQFDFKWSITGAVGWPTNCAIGLNMGLEAYVR